MWSHSFLFHFLVFDEFPLSFSSVVQSLSCVQIFATPWTAAHQASLSFTNSQSLLKLMSIELVMLSNSSQPLAPFSFCCRSFPASGFFSNELGLCVRWPKYWSFTSASVFPMSIQGWFPLGLTGLISLLSKGPSRVCSSSTMRKHQLCSAQLFL